MNPCGCKLADHRHGHYRTWDVHRCCDLCHAAYNRRRKQDRNIRTPLADATAVTAHLQRCMAVGMTLHQLVTLTGLPQRTLWELREGLRDRCTQAVWGAIMGVTPAPSDQGVVDATGSIRRVRGLMVAGWSSAQIGAAAGLSKNSILNISKGRNESVRHSTLVAIEQATRELFSSPPPSGRVASGIATTSRRKGWAPLAAWDDIDDPSDRPHGVTRRAAA